MKTLHDLFLNELADVYDANKRSVPVLATLAGTATGIHLKRALRMHERRTLEHRSEIEEVFRLHGAAARSRTCEATTGLLREIQEITGEFRGSPAIDAAVISAGQKIGHYAIVSYGCLSTWSRKLGEAEAAVILERILEGERKHDLRLSRLARARSNRSALGEGVAEGRHRQRRSPKKKAH